MISKVAEVRQGQFGDTKAALRNRASLIHYVPNVNKVAEIIWARGKVAFCLRVEIGTITKLKSLRKIDLFC